jgi:hypothetical protein
MTERNLHEEIDDLSRELTAEIEAHRLTRSRAEKAANERDEARRVAKVLATYVHDSEEWAEGIDSSGPVYTATRTALAYPGREP